MLKPVRATHAAFLRTIGAGDRRLTSDELQAAVAPLDFAAVATWQQRGDVVFRPEVGADSAELERRISGALEAELGVAIPAVVRTAEQVLTIATDVPFTAAQVERTDGHVQVLLVRDKPVPEAVAAVLELATADDELEWRCRELWWLPRAEAADSALGAEQLEEALGAGALRSHRSVAGLLARHLAP